MTTASSTRGANTSIIIDALTTVPVSVNGATKTTTSSIPTIPTTAQEDANSTYTNEDHAKTKPAMAAATVIISVVLVVGALLCKCKC